RPLPRLVHGPTVGDGARPVPVRRPGPPVQGRRGARRGVPRRAGRGRVPRGRGCRVDAGARRDDHRSCGRRPAGHPALRLPVRRRARRSSHRGGAGGAPLPVHAQLRDGARGTLARPPRARPGHPRERRPRGRGGPRLDPHVHGRPDGRGPDAGPRRGPGPARAVARPQRTRVGRRRPGAPRRVPRRAVPGPTRPGRRGLGVTDTRRADRTAPWRSVGNSAATQVLVTGLSGLLGMFTARLIIEQAGVAQYAQYGLLSTLPSLVPFADLGMAAVVVNAVAGSARANDDPAVRRTLTSAFRILVCSGLTIVAVGVLLGALGWWPALLGPGLLEGGALTATVCVMVLGVALPCGVGARILVGLGRNPLQTALTGLTAPLVMAGVLVVLAVGDSSFLALATYVASAVGGVVLLVTAARLLRPQVGAA